jgi:hypothetical protein
MRRRITTGILAEWGCLSPNLEATMQFAADRLEAPTAIRTDLGAIFISLLVWTAPTASIVPE